jgi:hypothetical protein
MNEYQRNQVVRLSALFQLTYVDTDPTTVTLRLKSPAGESIIPSGSITKDSTGHYHYDVTVTPGLWNYRWTGAGVVNVSMEDEFLVKEIE